MRSRRISIATLFSLAQPKQMTKHTLLLVGCGNVGAGIAAASQLSKRWSLVIIDPCADLVPPGHTLLPHAIDEISDEVLAEHLTTCDEIIYAAECGNRDEYAARPEMARENCERFERFARRVASLGSRHIAYARHSRPLPERTSPEGPTAAHLPPRFCRPLGWC